MVERKTPTPAIEALRRSTSLVWFGGDYNPEQWPEAVLLEDIDLMQQAAVNTATLGVFSWAALEPKPGEYDFGWLDAALDRLHSAGVKVILATPTASPPPWFSRLHPEALPVTPDGVRLIHGSRDTYNPAAPAYRGAARRITRVLAERYGDHPALAMWHLHNEYGTVSYGTVTDVAFREWLQDAYGDLDRVNATWNTAFWSQVYSSWEDIHAPQRTQYIPNPSHLLDFKRFSSDMLLRCLRDQLEIVREVTPGDTDDHELHASDVASLRRMGLRARAGCRLDRPLPGRRPLGRRAGGIRGGSGPVLRGRSAVAPDGTGDIVGL